MTSGYCRRTGVDGRAAAAAAAAILLVLGAAAGGASAFAPPPPTTRAGGARLGRVVVRPSAAAAGPGPVPVPGLGPLGVSTWDGNTESRVLSDEEVAPIIRLNKGDKEKVVNAFGLWTLAVSVLTAPFWMAAMYLVDAYCKANPDWDPNMAVYDGTGMVWSKAWLTMTMSYPKITGDVDRLKEGNGPCLYVANHASWLDIPVLCTVLDPPFKFISKKELMGVPCIGQQLTGGNHILIDRSDRRSQLRTFKDSIGWLKKGVPLMAFPEGKRSDDGRLADFKGGIFSMAVKTGAPIVPISVANTHAVMPANALFPVQAGGDMLRVHVHEAIETEGLTEEEIGAKVRESLLSMLPPDQQPLPPREEVEKEIAEEILNQVVEKDGGKKKGEELQPSS